MPRKTRAAPLAADQIVSLLNHYRAEDDLRNYFDVGHRGGVPPYTGARFDSLGDGGHRPAVRDIVTTDDLVAVQMLSVLVPRNVALDLLEGELGRRVTAQLSRVPANIAIDDPRAKAALKDGSPADVAWRLLEQPDGMGWVTAGKLLARKRPALIPIYDSVVKCALSFPVEENAWLAFHRLFMAEPNLVHELRALMSRARVGATITPLRGLDVVLWMRHHATHRPSGCERLEF